MEQIICATLDALESQESVLLTWGNAQGFFSQIELRNIITQVLQSYPLAASGLTSFGVAKVMIESRIVVAPPAEWYFGVSYSHGGIGAALQPTPPDVSQARPR